MERILAGMNVIYPAVFGHELFYALKFFRKTVFICFARILAAAAFLGGGAGILYCRRYFRSGAVFSALHFSGSLAAFNHMLQENGCRDGSYSSRYGRYGFGDLIGLVVINVSAELAFLIDIHSYVDDDLAFS